MILYCSWPVCAVCMFPWAVSWMQLEGPTLWLIRDNILYLMPAVFDLLGSWLSRQEAVRRARCAVPCTGADLAHRTLIPSDCRDHIPALKSNMVGWGGVGWVKIALTVFKSTCHIHNLLLVHSVVPLLVFSAKIYLVWNWIRQRRSVWGCG